MKLVSFIFTLVNLPLLTSQLEAKASCKHLPGGVTSCSNQGLTFVPPDIPSSTKHLRLDGNRLDRIEAGDFPVVMTELEELNISENLIDHIDTSTFCHKLPNLRILRLTKNKLRTLPDLRFCSSLVELHSANNEIVRLDGKSISGLSRLEKLDLSKNNLTSISASMLPTNTSLRQLLLNNNEISEMSSGAFASVPTLERLKLSRNKLTSIPTELFSDLTNLLTLDLSKNRLTVIGHLYFIKLQKVKTINLQKNRITRLLDGSFYDCTALESLNLGSNLLNTVVAGPFFGLNNLNELLLDKNNISTIDENTWSQAPYIRTLDMSHNELQVVSSTDFNSARRVVSLTLANNKIKQLEENAFSHLINLSTLDLSGNELTDSVQSPSTTVFSSLSKLTSLDLKGNKLQTITSKLLKGLEELQTLELGNNPVTTVDSYAFSTLPKLSRLGLVTEKMVCDCKISWLQPWLQSKHLTSRVNVKCTLPRSIRGRDLFSVNSSLLICDDEMPIRPFITREIQPTNALKNSNVTLTCIATASSQSPVTVEWRKDNKVIPEASGLIRTEASTADDRVSLHTTYLKLINIDELADGFYQCRFKNEFGEDYSERAQLQVLVFPSFTNHPADVVVKTGQDAKLLCEATGDPQPFLSWSKDGGKNFPAARERRFHVNPVNLNEFIIKNVQWQDRGVYYCNATNIAGSIISNATLDVMVPPMFTEDISCTNTKAGAYLLKCQAEGNPKAPIVWYKDGKVIQASEKYVFSVTYNNLFILGATVEDSGKYKCSAQNLLGKVSRQCEIEINVRNATTEVPEVVMEKVKKPTPLDKNTITGLIVIAVVCCVVGTSLIWVVIIYQTRRRQSRSGSNETEETTVPLSGGNQTATNSTHKIGDSISNSSGSSQTKTDIFFEYGGDSPSGFSKGREKYPTMDSELAAAMEPLNPNQDSIDSLAQEAHTNNYSHHTVGAARDSRRMPTSVSDYYASERPAAHQFSTFQPSRHHRTHSGSTDQRTKPSHSISAEYIPYTDRRLPPHLSHVLHQLHAPPQLPHAVVSPVHSHHTPVSSCHLTDHYEDPGYMNLPRSAVRPKTTSHSEEHSDYMNVAPKDIHIYQNSSILSINPNDNDADPHEGHSYHQQSVEEHPSIDNGVDPELPPNDLSPTSTASHLHSSENSTSSDSSNPNASTSLISPDSKSKYHRRREGLADSSFVERKYGLVFTGDVGERSMSNQNS